MVLNTAWCGLGWTEHVNVAPGGDGATLVLLTPATLNLTLAETPGVSTAVQLPVGTQAVRLYPSNDTIRLGLDASPLPPGTSFDEPVVPATSFHFGATLLPGAWAVLAIPQDTLPHTVHLTSSGPFTPVLLIALVE